MIQFNLLPDVKLAYLKSQRYKRLVVIGSIIASSVTLAVFVMLLVAVNVVQKRHMANLDRDIADSSNRLKEQPDLDKILTVQNQLNSLPELHAQKPAVTRLFAYLSQVTPNDGSISSLDVDFAQNIMKFEGEAKDLSIVNKFVDTLKFTEMKGGDAAEGGKPFRDVVLAGFDRTEDGASYQITLVFEPVIFNNSQSVQLTVPNIITTRSSTEKPSALFENPSNLETEE